MRNIGVLELFKQLEELDLLSSLYRNGMISTRVIHHRDIYLFFDALIQAGMTKNEAIEKTVAEFNVSRQTVYNAFYTVQKSATVKALDR
jgi:hypothetical protein